MYTEISHFLLLQAIFSAISWFFVFFLDRIGNSFSYSILRLKRKKTFVHYILNNMNIININKNKWLQKHSLGNYVDHRLTFFFKNAHLNHCLEKLMWNKNNIFQNGKVEGAKHQHLKNEAGNNISCCSVLSVTCFTPWLHLTDQKKSTNKKQKKWNIHVSLSKSFILSALYLSLTLSFFGTISNYVCSDFSIYNTLTNSTADIPLFYKISATWSNHEGSLLLWCWLLSLNTFLFHLNTCSTEFVAFSIQDSFPLCAKKNSFVTHLFRGTNKLYTTICSKIQVYHILKLKSASTIEKMTSLFVIDKKRSLLKAQSFYHFYTSKYEIRDFRDVKHRLQDNFILFEKGIAKMFNGSNNQCLQNIHNNSIRTRDWIVFFRSTNLVDLFPKKQQYSHAITSQSAELILLFFSIFCIFTSNPFLRTSISYIISLAELNPILQDPVLAIHPPCIYAGYVASAIAFSISISILMDLSKSKK